MRYAVLVVCLTFTAIAGNACAPKAPANFSPEGQRAVKAQAALNDIKALSETAINLNHQTGREHLSDQNTAYVRDFALSATVAVQSYSDGHDTLATAVGAFSDLSRKLQAEANLPSGLRAALAVVDKAIRSLQSGS